MWLNRSICPPAVTISTVSGVMLPTRRPSSSIAKPIRSGLVHKRQEIAAELGWAQSRLNQLILDVDALDATIQFFKPDVNLDVLPRWPSAAAVRGAPW